MDLEPAWLEVETARDHVGLVGAVAFMFPDAGWLSWLGEGHGDRVFVDFASQRESVELLLGSWSCLYVDSVCGLCCIGWSWGGVWGQIGLCFGSERAGGVEMHRLGRRVPQCMSLFSS